MNEIKIQLPKPHTNQQKILDSKAKYKVILAGRQFGKSLLCLIVAISRMLEGKKVAYITPTFLPLGKEFFDALLKYLPEQIISKSNAAGFSIELITGGSIRFFSGESLSRFRGITKISLLIIDEAAHIANLKSEFGTAIMPTLLAANGDIIAISTPAGREMFYSLYEKGLNGVENWESFHFTSYDNPTLPQEALENLKSTLTEFQYQQEMLAIAGSNANGVVATECINNNIIQELSTKEPVCFGVDLAKYSDYTVLVGLDEDGSMCYFQRFQKPWEQTKELIADVANRYPRIPFYLDRTGVGDVVTEQLQLTCGNINGFLISTETKPKIIYGLVKAIEEGLTKYNEACANELHTFEYKYSSTGYLSFAAKQGFNDDIILALAIAWHHRAEAIAASNWKLYTA